VPFARVELLPSPEQIEYAELLLRRADDHVRVSRLLKDDVVVTDEIIGLHAHAAVDKSLKVALVLAGVELPITGDLDLLVQLACAHGADAPPSVLGAGWLTP
jgi:HEPN domain-containing protein